jgi:uncharacterized protein (DUF4415 family)
MAQPPFRTRHSGSARDVAEAAFKAATTKPQQPLAKPAAPPIPNAREQVTLRIDRDILEHFQAGGPGWQDRINAALRAAFEAATETIATDDLNAENDG